MSLSPIEQTVLVDALTTYRSVADLPQDDLALVLRLTDKLDGTQVLSLDEYAAQSPEPEDEQGAPLMVNHPSVWDEDEDLPGRDVPRPFMDSEDRDLRAAYEQGAGADCATASCDCQPEDDLAEAPVDEQPTAREQLAGACLDLASAAQQVTKLYVFHGNDLAPTHHALAQLAVATHEHAMVTLGMVQQDPHR